MITCEAVLSEAFFLLRAARGGCLRLAEMLRQGGISCRFDLGSEMVAVCKLLVKYAYIPMSLADARIVRMSELHSEYRILTLDGDFTLYRRNTRQRIPLVIPPERIRG
jgi:hypothetical protein